MTTKCGATRPSQPVTKDPWILALTLVKVEGRMQGHVSTDTGLSSREAVPRLVSSEVYGGACPDPAVPSISTKDPGTGDFGPYCGVGPNGRIVDVPDPTC